MASSARGEWLDDLLTGFTAYYLTSLPVFLGILFGVDFPRPSGVDSTQTPDLILASIHSDALHYLDIIQHGYSYDPSKGSMVAFFPAYPLLSRWIGQAAGLTPGEAALAMANLALLGAFVLLTRYVRARWPEATASQRGFVLAIFGLWPLALFFRMPFTESLFACVTLAVLYGMARGWPLLVLALLTGFVTAVRPVGMALTASFVWHVLTRPEIRPRARAIQVLLLAPLACWGLLAYMGYQWRAFDTPWAFVQTQEYWVFLAPEDSTWLAKLGSLVTLEPIWGVYMPGNRRYWGHAVAGGDPLFSLFFWNPILFLLAGALLVWGGRKRWLTGSEIVLGAALLAIPYVTRAFEMSMASHGRFAAVVVVNYLVMGRMLARSSPLVLAALCSTLALFLFIFTFLYTKDSPIF